VIVRPTACLLTVLFVMAATENSDLLHVIGRSCRREGSDTNFDTIPYFQQSVM